MTMMAHDLMDTRPCAPPRPKPRVMSLVPSEPVSIKRRRAMNTTRFFIKEIPATLASYVLTETLSVLCSRDEHGYFVLEASDPVLHITGVSDSLGRAAQSFFDHFDDLYCEFSDTTVEETHELARPFRSRILAMVASRDESAHVD